MRAMRRVWIASAFFLALLVAAPTGAAPRIDTSDVERFYAVYDAARGMPTAEDLQRRYLDPGSDGLHQFAAMRDITGIALAAAIAKDHTPYEKARRCAQALPAIRARLGEALARLDALVPEAVDAPVTLVIGRTKTGGTTSRAGVLIGLETLCAADFLEADLEDRFVHLIAHEYAHVQQPAAEETDRKDATLLFSVLIEGGAEFVGRLISGDVAYVHLRRWTAGREREIETAFLADVARDDKTAWLYNGPGSPAKPGDLGYWVGYRIVSAYYRNVPDQRRAILDILHVTPETAPGLLARSGWSPGTSLHEADLP